MNSLALCVSLRLELLRYIVEIYVNNHIGSQ